jgi:putative heme-binding domain-containing protein
MRLICIVGLALLLPGSLQAAEKWADAKFPLPDSPALWLDASKQKSAFQAHGRTLANGSALDVWYDASGNGIHLSQRVQKMQPHFFEAGGVGLVRFQGQEFLGRTGPLPGLKEFSLFLVTVPRSNKGNFQGWFATSELGKNDYVTGITVDQHVGARDSLAQINVEGKGFGGAVNLMKETLPFGRLRLLRVEGTQTDIKLAIDGKPQGQRPRRNSTLSMDTLTVGARYYSNSGNPPFVQGFFDGDIAEVLLFRRNLKPEETSAIENYLNKKYAGLAKELVSGTTNLGHFLRPVADPPPVQMLLPGFTVREIPVKLPNINNVRYRHDGKLVALGYNGNVYLLSDTDGDGLEDKVQVFWENKTGMRGPIGILLTPKGYEKGQGLFVANKGKVSLIVDTDGDDKADKEIVVAQGWKEIAQAVDALGVAMDKKGNLYFGLGTADFANAYLKTKDGKALFDINSDRGTIQKLSPDFKKRETVCTGIRFPVGLSFNRHGDLFCTDQEGATWLPNGNPFDELLHIEAGKHYGFPPRHPKHLPDVIDEPSVFDYGPQHQSTCGLFFNESVNGGPVFGPKDWAGDALICGESRGKLFRTKLIKTKTGYIAQNHLFACLQMLTIDACVSPQGDLVVCCHSGPPDWGTGPQGIGKLFKISFTDKRAPQPLFAYAAGPREVRIPFDRPLDPVYLKTIAGKVKIECGQYVRPGDGFETLQPPYAIVKMQLATPRFDLPVHSVQVTGDRRTLVLTTGPHTQAVSYAVTLPGFGPAKKHNTIDLGYDLTGILVEWTGKDGQKWSGWLPHFDLEVSKAFTAGSAEHKPFWKMIRKPGKFTVKANLDLFDMLRPAVQPGAQLDFTLPREEVRLTLESPGPLGDSAFPGTMTSGTLNPNKGHWYAITTQVDKDVDWPMTASFHADKGMSFFRAYYRTDEDRRDRALPLRRLFLPWVERKPQKLAVLANRDHPQLKGGNWSKGYALFHSEKVLCGRCHQVQGKGGLIGPDLSNLIHRDYDSVLRDIRFPSAALNPDYLSYLVNMKDGRSLTGTLRGDGDKLWVGNSEGKETPIARDGIAKLVPSAISIMPEGLEKKLTAEEMRDLLTFLLTEPLQPAPLERKDAPPPRKKGEVDTILKGVKRPDGPLKKLHIVLAAGPKDHGPGEHDYPLWQRRWLDLLLAAPEVKVSTAMGWPNARQWKSADLVVFYSANPAWAPAKAKDLDAFLERGGGLVFIHWAIEGRKDASLLAERIGLAANAAKLKYRHGPLEIAFAGKHPITQGFGKVRFVDESYWNMVGDPGQVNVLGASMEDGQARPQLWTFEKGRGRVFVNILGHYTWTFDDPLYRILLLRGMAWAARQDVNRWIDLATIGVRMEE